MTDRDKPSPALVRGWCPGALHPMETGDGFLVRIRLTAGVLAAPIAQELADLSRSFGNELIDLSQRGNLQLRGVQIEDLSALQSALDDLGLLDADVGAEAVRNVIAPPLAGLDPTAAIDGRALATALEHRLAEEIAVHALPGKFGFAIDDGGRLSLADVGIDVRLTGLTTADGPRVVISVATPKGHRPIAVTSEAEAVDRALDLARAVVRLRADVADAPRRMAEIVARFGLPALLDAADFGDEMAEIATLPRAGGAEAVLGDHTHGPVPFFGVGAPFGRLSADQLALIGELAGERGIGEARLTPWRTVLVPGVKPEKMPRIRPWIAAGRFVFSTDDPRLAVACCAGSSGCRQASVAAREDGEALAPLARHLARSGTTLHVSGCEKGCAHPAPALVTLVGRDGRYDLVRDGRPWDTPRMTGLTTAEAASALADLAPP